MGQGCCDAAAACIRAGPHSHRAAGCRSQKPILPPSWADRPASSCTCSFKFKPIRPPPFDLDSGMQRPWEGYLLHVAAQLGGQSSQQLGMRLDQALHLCLSCIVAVHHRLLELWPLLHAANGGQLWDLGCPLLPPGFLQLEHCILQAQDGPFAGLAPCFAYGPSWLSSFCKASRCILHGSQQCQDSPTEQQGGPDWSVSPSAQLT